jgi:outer membrane murein-binding lipoprotein Lpp
MSRDHKALMVVVVAALGLWGCAQGNSKPVASSEERVKALEARYDSLEKKCKAVLADRERAETRVAALEKERLDLLKLVEHGKGVSRERDSLKVLVGTRTAERDALQTQFEELRKGIRSLLGRVESALPPADSQGGAAPVNRPKL